MQVQVVEDCSNTVKEFERNPKIFFFLKNKILTIYSLGKCYSFPALSSDHISASVKSDPGLEGTRLCRWREFALLPQNERCALPVLEPKDLSVLDHRARVTQGKTPDPFSARNVKSTPHNRIVSAVCPDNDCSRLISVF